MRSRLPATIVLGLAAAALVAIAVCATTWRGFDVSRPLATTGEARVGGSFRLRDQHGVVVSDQLLRGRVVLIHFGHTTSNYETPAMLQVMTAVIEVLGGRGEGVAPVFITLDPARDTRMRLQEMAKQYHPKLQTLTGSASEIDAVAKAYHLALQRLPDASVPGGYVIEYPARIYLMDKNGRFVDAIELGTPAKDIVSLVAKLL